MQQKLFQRLKSEVFDQFTHSRGFGAQVGVLKKGRAVFIASYGKKYDFFDLASLTKTMVTADYFLKHPDLRSKKISNLLPWLPESTVKVSDLLGHAAGFEAHLKLFRILKDRPFDERSVEVKKILRHEFKKAKPKSKPVYSDLDFLLLGFVIENLESCSIAHYFERENEISELHYNGIPFKGEKKRYAPSEFCKRRNKKLKGEVLDGNAYFLGGAAPHAGLFGSLDSMMEYGKKIRRLYSSNASLFKPQNKEWAYGFMIPSGKTSTAGKYFSKKSVGHLGFTGVSFWFDPEADLFVTVLSNRTYPDRDDSRFNRFRALIHDTIYEETMF